MIQLTEQLRLNLNSNLNMNLNLQWKLKLRLTSCSYLCVMWEKQKGFRALRTFPDCRTYHHSIWHMQNHFAEICKHFITTPSCNPFWQLLKMRRLHSTERKHKGILQNGQTADDM